MEELKKEYMNLRHQEQLSGTKLLSSDSCFRKHSQVHIDYHRIATFKNKSIDKWQRKTDADEEISSCCIWFLRGTTLQRERRHNLMLVHTLMVTPNFWMTLSFTNNY
nr:uncharacterized protein LOC103427653 isoform X2 [Malus domestica]